MIHSNVVLWHRRHRCEAMSFGESYLRYVCIHLLDGVLFNANRTLRNVGHRISRLFRRITISSIVLDDTIAVTAGQWTVGKIIR